MKLRLVAAMAAAALLSACGLNSVPTAEEAAKAKWADVQAAYQRRADLIPNLVETVKGFAAQEKDVFSNIAEARAALGGARTPAERIAANDQISSALSRLLVVVENYPELRSNQNEMRK